MHRVFRLYTSPASSSGEQRRVDAVSTVRPTITILDEIDAATISHLVEARPLAPAQTAAESGWDDLFDQPHSTAAELFT